MTDPADLVLTDGEVHTLAPPPDGPAGWPTGDGDAVHEAVAVRDGAIVRVGSAYEVGFLAGVDTRVVDLDGRVVLPGFVDAHTHLESTGRYLVHADLSAADSLGAALDVLREEPPPDREWVLGFGYDESDWPADRYLRRDDLDRVSDERPVAAVRVDMHTASLNAVAMERLRAALPEDDLAFAGGEPTGVIRESAVDVLRDAIDPGVAATRDIVTAAVDRARSLGVTCVHEKVRNSHAPRVYRELAAAGELGLRVRVDYWSDHLDAVEELGLRTGDGGRVRTGAIKSFTDGSFGAWTAKLTEPYADAPAGEAADDSRSDEAADDPRSDAATDDAHGEWVVDPDALRALVERVDGADLQLAVHAIGDEAVAETLDAFQATPDPAAARHRVEHAELLPDELLEQLAAAGVVASCQPNFLRWADDGGLYDRRLGAARRRRTNRFRDMLDAGVPLAFGSDSMPLGPLVGVHHAVNAPDPAQRLDVTEALRAYTLGGAYAGFDEDRLGTVEVGKRADLVALEASPWDRPDAIDAIDVALTVVDGEVVHDAR